MKSIGERIVRLLLDLNFEHNPVIVHCFSNGGAFLYQNFALALESSPKPVRVRGVIFDSAPGRRRISRLYRAISVILGGGVLYNFPVSLVVTVFVSAVWLWEVVKGYLRPNSVTFQSDPLETLKDERNRWPQLFVYSKADDLIPYTVRVVRERRTVVSSVTLPSSVFCAGHRVLRRLQEEDGGGRDDALLRGDAARQTLHLPQGDLRERGL